MPNKAEAKHNLTNCNQIFSPSAKDVEAFRNLWREVFGEDLPEDRAHEEAVACLRLMQLIYRPMSAEDRTVLQGKRGKLLAELAVDPGIRTPRNFPPKMAD